MVSIRFKHLSWKSRHWQTPRKYGPCFFHFFLKDPTHPHLFAPPSPNS